MIWALKIAAKLVLSRLPVRYDYWKRLGLFRHGRMDSTDYAEKIFNLHVGRAYPEGLPAGACILELGPGDSIVSSLVAFAHGAARTVLVDVGPYACRDVSFYRRVSAQMSERNMAIPDLSGARCFEDVLAKSRAEYFTAGLESLRAIPTESVDFLWSHSVLEHVRVEELSDLLGELRRILKPSGLSSHNVDYQDHLAGALNNLRFSEQTWESALFASSGFYTNRVPAIAMHSLFRQVGFRVLDEAFGRWPYLPTPRDAMSKQFDKYSDDDLLNRTSSVLLAR